MHEFFICRSIVDAVLDELSKLGGENTKLLRARIVVGGFHQIVPDNLHSAYEVLIKDTPAEGSSLEIEQWPITAVCRQCGWNGEIKGFICLCDACGAADLEITGGKELYLDKLEIEQDEN